MDPQWRGWPVADLREVARQAGVSVSTASRALAGVRHVQPHLVERVQRVADELGYRPNTVARSLRRKETGIVGMIIPELQNPFFPGLVAAFESELAAADLDLLLSESHSDAATEVRRVRALLDRQVDAMILSPCHEEDSMASLEACADAGTPVITVDRAVVGASVPWVGLDDAVGMEMAVAWLVGRGCRRLAFASGAQRSSSGHRRRDGFLAACERHGVTVTDVLVGEFSLEWGMAAAVHLTDIPDGVVCGNDLVALGVIRGLRRRGLSVPGEVQVTGCDDSPIAGWADTPLTTLRQPTELIARACVQRFVVRAGPGGRGADDAPADPDDPLRVSVQPELVVRDSTR
jgi:LacI family transcriptional regulator